MRFLANENIPAASIDRLRTDAHDILSIGDTTPGITDREVLQKAVDQHRVVLTFDSDYGELIFRRNLPRPPGVIFYRFTPESPEEAGELTLTLVDDPDIELDGMFSVVQRSAVRQRPIDPD
jgi:predicted nuclease of predicted toxin-antitoxin system